MGRRSGPREEDSDRDLVKCAQRGGRRGKGAFEVLVRKNRHWLVRYLYSLLGRQSDAEDVAQESLAQAYIALPRLQKADRFIPWLRQIATRRAFNHRRHEATRKKYEAASGDLPRTQASPSGSVEAHEVLFKAMGSIAYAYREVLVLYYVEDLSLKEIAHALDLGISAAKMRLSRARNEFRAVYKVNTHG